MTLDRIATLRRERRHLPSGSPTLASLTNQAPHATRAPRRAA